MRGKPCSHPGKLLEDHLTNTKDIALSIAGHYGLSLSLTEQAALLMHDLGKAHPAFQKRLCRACPAARSCPEVCIKSSPEQVYIGHAAPSASLAMAYTRDVILSEAIRRHHTALQDLTEVKAYWVNGDYTDRVKELEAIYTWSRAAVLELWDQVPASWLDNFPDEDDWYNLCFDVLEMDLPEDDPRAMSQLWIELRKIYSLLAAADRWDAAVGEQWQTMPLNIQPGRIQDFMQTVKDKARELGRSGLAQWRTAVYEQVLAHSAEKITAPGLYTLTLPTGAGKTLVGLSIAALAARRFSGTGIIYVLPFISLVEQNAGVARQLFDRVQEDHYLAYQDNNEIAQYSEDTARREFLSFFRYWDAPVIVTTLSKLWEVIYSPRANDSMNFHRLSRAVVVFDEPQSIPVKYWEGLGKTLELIAKKWDTTFILMTATQPRIVEGVELVKEKVHFPRERYSINWVDEPLTVDDLPVFLDDKGWRTEDSLVILNTRESALRTFLAAVERKLPAYLLSRWLTPADRTQKMQTLQKMEEQKQQRCLVSTQVVEAGVDLDFALAFRDLAPFDSIIQAAGRCNRHAGYEGLREVWVAELKNEQGRALSSYVYDKTLLNQTRTILAGCKMLPEREVPDKVSEYYRLLEQAVSQDEIWPDLCSGRWGSYRYLYDLQMPEVSLLIDSDGTAAGLLEELSSLPSGYKTLARRRNISRELGMYAISVREKYLEEWDTRLAGFMITQDNPILEKINPNLWILHPPGIGQVYSSHFGFIPLKYYEQIRDIDYYDDEGGTD
jgi:CRISPR-associated endonuclease/helicase Cas3